MNTYSKDVYYLPGVVVGPRDIAVNKIQKAIPVAIKKHKEIYTISDGDRN